GAGPLDRGRLVPDRRRGDPRRHREHQAHRPDQGPGEVGRRVDLLGGSGERADGSPRGEGGRGRGGGPPPLGGAAAGHGGPEGRRRSDRGGAQGLALFEIPEVLGPGRRGVRRVHSPHLGGEVQEVRAARALRRLALGLYFFQLTSALATSSAAKKFFEAFPRVWARWARVRASDVSPAAWRSWALVQSLFHVSLSLMERSTSCIASAG